MRLFQILIMPLDNGYCAVVGGTAVDAYSLDGFGLRLEEALRRNVGDDIEVEYALSPDLKAKLPPCSVCDGSERVDLPGTVGGQTLRDEWGSIDFSQRATTTCPACKGAGADIPEFWGSSAQRVAKVSLDGGLRW